MQDAVTFFLLQRLSVLVHDLGEQRPVGGGRVGHGVGPGPDGAEDALLRGAAGGDDGHLRELPADPRYDLRGGGGAVTYTPPTNGALFAQIMDQHRKTL